MSGDLLTYKGAMPKSTAETLKWHASRNREIAIEPDMPIIDPHLHIFGSNKDTHFYRLEDYTQDLAGGHRVLKTVYIEAYRSGWRTSGPDHLRSVGEVEMIVAQTEQALVAPFGNCEFAAGIVANVDFTKGAWVSETLEAHTIAAKGRLRGVRQVAAYDDGLVGSFIKELPPERLMQDQAFQEGLSKLNGLGLSFDVWIYHHQLLELISLVDKFPEINFVLNHLGGLIGIDTFRVNRADTLAIWKLHLQYLAERPNVFIKVGGMGMPVFGFGFEHQVHPATSQQMAAAWRPLIETCISVFGTNRCMFESNFPVDRQSAGYTEVWNAFKAVTKGMTPTERRQLFFETASQVYRLY